MDPFPPPVPRSGAAATDEADVLRRMAVGHSNKEIAGALDISVKTVEVHKANAMRTLNLRTDVVRQTEETEGTDSQEKPRSGDRF